MILSLTNHRLPERGRFCVLSAHGRFATLRMHLSEPHGVTVERDVQWRPDRAGPSLQLRDVVPMRRLDAERWELAPFYLAPGMLPVQVTLIQWAWSPKEDT